VDAIESVIGRMRGKCGLAEVAVGIEHAFAHYPSRMENDPAEEVPGGVAIMTVHQAKGLEFPYVYLVDMTDEFFPRTTRETALLDAASDAALKAAIARNEREVGAPDSASGDSFMDGTSARLMPEMEEQLREERRLAYVALTRAAKGMVICHAMESGLSEPVSLSPFACEFLGRAADDDPAVADNVADRPEDCRSRLREAMNRQEIESALRECVQTDGGEAVADEKFSRNLESLDLDAAFITTQSPFEPEDNLPLDLSERVYSASQLRSYLECPRQYYFEKILRLAPERVEDFGLGQLVHKALEVFHEEVTIISGDPVALEKTMEGALRSVWEGGASREGFAEKYQTALQRFAVEQRASEILKRYLLTEIEEAPGREIASCEETVSFDIDEFNFVARIDRIDRLGASDPDKGRHVIIDYKTSATTIIKAQTIKKKFINVDEKPEYRPTDFQMPLYLLAARSAGYEPVELSYYWLSQQNTDGKFKKGVLPVAPAGEDAGDSDSLTDAELELATENILSVTRKISAGLFEPSPDKAYSCSRCAFAAICTIGEEGFDGD
jgi:ATP-dependent exoDNAse (exonuclease V) beta subunit